MRPNYDRLPALLDPEALATLRARAVGFGSAEPAYPPSYRDNERLVQDDPALAAAIFARLRPHLGPQEAPDGSLWEPVGLNERVRFCRYRPGQRFTVHQDGVFVRGPEERSFRTVLIYLNEDFTGGLTRFFAARAGPVVDAVSPRAGDALVFEHTLWHDGAPVEQGVKLVFRSDVLYRRVRPPTHAGAAPAHEGYVWCLHALADGVLASGARDRTIRLEGPAGVRRQGGHALSVLDLAEPAPGRLVSASRDGTLRFWRREGLALTEERVVEAHAGAVLRLCALPGGRVASGGADGALRIWDATGALCAEQAFGAWVWSIARVGEALAVGTEQGTLHLGGRVVQAHAGPVHALCFGPEGLLSGGGDGWIRRWGPQWEPAGGFRAHEGAVYALALVPGGLASGGEDDTARVWSGGRERARFAHGGFVRALALLPDGRLACGSYDGTIRRWVIPAPGRRAPRAGSPPRPDPR